MTPREQVLQYYPKAQAKNIDTKKGARYYNIIHGGVQVVGFVIELPILNDNVLGKGKSSKAAWKSAMRNL